ncbi:ROK family protein [Alicyclobacillus acidoterrestris]|uniref:ROK family protein n=1 Tax=Alicyclobacillus acidoterrestris (strain ATCC 49025 / DSM 3922 / CIP 106132 / NCIMB 13137 / GD3B) TaxID=1356854 RepID=A0A9E7CZZ0_ALIAG|nr:ROK family protein [Alicyclobacillus acidoterrestris]UNO49192.1 ROK family protein [Alicyclobacillus acidoterrestris]
MTERVALGIDVGGTNVKVAFVKEDGTVIAQGSIPTDPARGPERFSLEVAEYAKALAQKNDIVWDSVTGAGVGLAAFMDVDKGWVEESVNLHWYNVPIGDLLSNALGKSVRMDNDANVAALGEVWLGAGRDARTALCVTLGTGVGGGIVIDGRIHRGVSTMAGEIGHIQVKNDGELCNCGHHGCLETLSSATALVRHAKEAGLVGQSEELTAKEVFDLAADGNEIAQVAVADMIHWLSLGLSIGANLLNPDVIIIAGGVVGAGDALIEPLRAAFARDALVRVSRSCTIVPATLGSQAGVLGAARLVFQ